MKTSENVNTREEENNEFVGAFRNLPSFEEHMEKLNHEDKHIKISDFENIVKTPANDGFIKSIVRKFLARDPEDMKIRGLEIPANMSVYNVIQTDPSGIEDFNLEDKNNLELLVSKDMCERNLDPRQSGYKQQPGWDTFKSWKMLNTERIAPKLQSQRLYISVPGGDLHRTAQMIYEKLRDDKIPFYFKIQDELANEIGRKDSIVLYTSAELLEKTVNALIDAGEKHPEIIDRCREPGETLGKVNNWIGYASEAKEDPDDSYTGIISKCVFAGMGRAIEEWGKMNQSYKISATGQTIDEYIGEAKVWMRSYQNKEKEELVRRMQTCLREIPKIEKATGKNGEFVKYVCDATRSYMKKEGLDTENVCMTPYAKAQLEEQFKK